MNTTTAAQVTGSDLFEGLVVRHPRLGFPVEIIGEMEWTGLGARYVDTGKRAFMTLGPRHGVHAMVVELDQAIDLA